MHPHRTAAAKPQSSPHVILTQLYCHALAVQQDKTTPMLLPIIHSSSSIINIHQQQQQQQTPKPGLT
jgi:hypothetical protein